MNGGSGLSCATRWAEEYICSAVRPPGAVGVGDGNGESLTGGVPATPEPGSRANAGAAETIAAAASSTSQTTFMVSLGRVAPGLSTSMSMVTELFDVWIQIRERTVRVGDEPEAEIPARRVEMRPDQRRAFREHLIGCQLLRRDRVLLQVWQCRTAVRLDRPRTHAVCVVHVLLDGH